MQTCQAQRNTTAGLQKRIKTNDHLARSLALSLVISRTRSIVAPGTFHIGGHAGLAARKVVWRILPRLPPESLPGPIDDFLAVHMHTAQHAVIAGRGGAAIALDTIPGGRLSRIHFETVNVAAARTGRWRKRKAS